jgi:hypothetical protein
VACEAGTAGICGVVKASSSPSRPRHDGTSIAETAIFEATEKLLAEHSLQDLSVAQFWEHHRPTLRATMEHWSTNKEIGRQWIAGVELFTAALA